MGGGEVCQEVVLVSPKGVTPGPKPGTGFQLLSHWERTWADVRLEVLAPHWLSSLCLLLGPELGGGGDEATSTLCLLGGTHRLVGLSTPL